MVTIECMRFTAPGSCLFLWLKKELDSDYTLLDPSVARQTIPPSLYLWDIWKMFDQNIRLSYLITLWHEVKCHHHQWFPEESSLFCAEVSLKYLWRFGLMNTAVLASIATKLSFSSRVCSTRRRTKWPSTNLAIQKAQKCIWSFTANVLPGANQLTRAAQSLQRIDMNRLKHVIHVFVRSWPILSITILYFQCTVVGCTSLAWLVGTLLCSQC